MKAFAKFLGLIVLGLAAIAILGYPLWLLLPPQFNVLWMHVEAPFDGVAVRTGELVLIIGFIWLVRREGLANKPSLGYGLPRRIWLREAGIAFLLGIATMLPVMLAMIALDLRDLKPDVSLDSAWLLRQAASGLGSALAVAFMEDTFVRGAMFTAVARESGPRLAIILPSLLYASLHFLGGAKLPPEAIGPGSGLVLLGDTLQRFAHPLAIFDAFVSLFAVGVLLAMVRHLTGSIAACVGLHAGWVWMILFMRKASVRDPGHPASFLLSEFDGVVGWLVLGWTLVLGVVLFRFYKRRQRLQGLPGAA